MANINLLGQNNQELTSRSFRLFLGRAVSASAALILVVFSAIFWWIVWREQDIKAKATVEHDKLAAIEQAIIKDPDRQQVLLRQGQIREINLLWPAREYWSRLLPELARVTLKSSSYVNLVASSDHVLSLSIIVPDFAELDKYLQVFKTTDFGTNFKDVRIVSANRFQTDKIKGVRAEVQVNVRPELLKLNQTKEAKP